MVMKLKKVKRPVYWFARANCGDRMAPPAIADRQNQEAALLLDSCTVADTWLNKSRAQSPGLSNSRYGSAKVGLWHHCRTFLQLRQIYGIRYSTTLMRHAHPLHSWQRD